MCELCKAVTEENKLSDKFFTLVCRTCNIPMLVLVEHKAELTEAEETEAEALRQEHFPSKRRRGYMRSILDHWHDHLI